MSKRIAPFVVLAIALGAAAIRSYMLTARSLWFDEAFSWRLIQFPISEMISRAAADVHPPLYYLILKGWSLIFGSSIAALRSLSVVAAAGTIAAAYGFTASAARSRAAGLLAALLLAVSAWQIQFAWEARMYTLGSLLAILSAWTLLQAMRAQPQRVAWWALYAVLTAAFAYIHYYAFFSIAAHAVFVAGSLLVSARARRWWYALLAALGALTLYLPWLPIFWQQNKQVQDSYWIGSLGGWSIPDTFYRMFIPTAAIPRHDGLGWIILALLPMIGTLVMWALLVKRRSRPPLPNDSRWLIFLLGVVPFILSITLSLISQSLYQDRFFVFAHLYILIALAALLSAMPWPTVRRVSSATAVIFLAATALLFWLELDLVNKPGARAATQFIFENRQSSEPILVSSPFIYFSVLHYAQEEWHASPPPRLYSATGQLAHFAGGPILTPADLAGPDLFSTPSKRLWIVDTTGFGGVPLVPPAAWRPAQRQIFREVFPHQGVITATAYERGDHL